MKKFIFFHYHTLLILFSFTNVTLIAMDSKVDKSDSVNSPVFISTVSRASQLMAVATFYMSKLNFFSPITRWYIVLTMMTGGIGFYVVRKWVLCRIWSNTEEIKKVTKQTKETLETLANESSANFSTAQQERQNINKAVNEQGDVIEQVKSQTDLIESTVTKIDEQVKKQEVSLKKVHDLTINVQDQLLIVEKNLTINKNTVAKNMSDLTIIVDNGFNDLNKRCDNLQEKLTILEPNIKKMINESLEKNTSQVSEQFEVINEQLKALRGQKKLLFTRLSSLKDSSENGHNELCNQLEQLGNNMTSLTNKVNNFLSCFSHLESDVTQMKDDITNIKIGTVNMEKYAQQQTALLQELLANQGQISEKSSGFFASGIKFFESVLYVSNNSTPKKLLLTDK